MSLAEETSRVAGGGKQTLKAILQKLGVTVSDDKKIDEYAALASTISEKLLPNNLLSESTASLYGKESTATVDQILSTINTLIKNAQTTANSKSKIVYGTYVGTGSAGPSSQNVLQFDFEPKLLLVVSKSNFIGIFFYPIKGFVLEYKTPGSNVETASKLTTTWGKTVKWYNEPSTVNPSYAIARQLNDSGETYYYCSFDTTEV